MNLTRPLAFGTAQNMDVGTPAGTFKQAGNENFAFPQNNAADRAYAVPVPAKAVDAAFYVHEAIFTAVYGRVGHGAYQFPIAKFGRTDGTDLRVAR